MRIPFGGSTTGLAALATGLAFALAASTALAQSGPFPNRPLKIIVPYSAGTGSDVLARTIGIFDTQRSPLLPEVPPMAEEIRVAGYTPTPVWYGFLAPAGTPREAVATLNELIQGAMRSNEVKERLTGLGAQPITRTNEQFEADMKSELEKAGQLAKKLGTYK